MPQGTSISLTRLTTESERLQHNRIEPARGWKTRSHAKEISLSSRRRWGDRRGRGRNDPSARGTEVSDRTPTSPCVRPYRRRNIGISWEIGGGGGTHRNIVRRRRLGAVL